MRRRQLLAAALLLLAVAAAALASDDDDCSTSSSITYRVGNALHRGHPGMALRGESFTVYSRPMRTKYAEVYNARQAPIPLPPEIVDRFRDRVIGASSVHIYGVNRFLPSDLTTDRVSRAPTLHRYN